MCLSGSPRCAAVVLSLALSGASFAGDTPELTSITIASNLQKAVFLTHAPGDFQRLFIVEQGGKIKIIRDGIMLAAPFLDIAPLVASGALETGLLGLAFHPDYQRNGYFYVTYSAPPQSTAPTLIARFRVTADPEVADPTSNTLMLRIVQNTTLHRSGWLGFGPDGYLYMSSGDGGPEGDPNNNGANLGVLKGKLLRLDVNGPDGAPATADDDEFPADPDRNYRIPADNPFIAMPGALPEIWAYGLRNPWRCAFDRLTGDLWISDVGQQTREEIDFQPAASPGGEFYGWRCWEGSQPYQACPAAGLPFVAPIHEYPTPPAHSVIGGYVYRGCEMPEVRGRYFFGDWLSGSLRSFRYSPTEGVTGLWQSATDITGGPSSFGEDAFGELYSVEFGFSDAAIRKIVPITPSGLDCNRTGTSDACDIAAGFSADVNGNGVPDECERLCAADVTPTRGDGSVNGLDLASLLAAWSGARAYAGCPPHIPHDLNHDCKVNGLDLASLLAAWGPCR